MQFVDKIQSTYHCLLHQDFLQGGLSTQQEMCVVFIHYYPKIPLALCQAIPERNQLWNYFGIKQAT